MKGRIPQGTIPLHWRPGLQPNIVRFFLTHFPAFLYLNIIHLGAHSACYSHCFSFSAYWSLSVAFWKGSLSLCMRTCSCSRQSCFCKVQPPLSTILHSIINNLFFTFWPLLFAGQCSRKDANSHRGSFLSGGFGSDHSCLWHHRTAFQVPEPRHLETGPGQHLHSNTPTL